MKRIILGVGLSVCLLLGLVIVQQSDATAEQASRDAVSYIADSIVLVPQAAEPAPEQYESCTPQADLSGLEGTQAVPYKKCSFNSDCPYGKCKSGKCGSCSFNSDCKGWGKCKSGQCGACSFNSECKDFGGCSSGRCKKSPD